MRNWSVLFKFNVGDVEDDSNTLPHLCCDDKLKAEALMRISLLKINDLNPQTDE